MASPVKKKSRKGPDYMDCLREKLETVYRKLKGLEFKAIYMGRKPSLYTGESRDLLKVTPTSLKMNRALQEVCKELEQDSSVWKGITTGMEGDYTLWIQPKQTLELHGESTFQVTGTEVLDGLIWKNRKYKALVNIEVERLELPPSPSYMCSYTSKPSDIEPFGYLREPELIEKRRFHLTAKRESFEWEEYGFRLHVPESCLPLTKVGLPNEGAALDVGISLSGPFKFPPNTKLVSAVYWLHSSIKLETAIRLEIQHCTCLTDPSHCSELFFVITPCNQGELPYQFQPLEGGVFRQNDYFGSITRSQFSCLAIVRRLWPWKGLFSSPRSVEQYCGQQLYQHSQSDWTLHFVVIKNLKACLSALAKMYSSGITTMSKQFTFQFEKDMVYLDIKRGGVILENGWKIIPMHSPQVSKEEVDCFTFDGVIPGFELKLKWTLMDQSAVFLNHPLTLHGAKGDVFFTLYISDPDSITGALPQSGGEAGELPLSRSSSSATGEPYGLDSSPRLEDFLNNVAVKIPHEAEFFGIQLGVPLNYIKSRPEKGVKLLSEIFIYWKEHCPPEEFVWAKIIDVLRAPCIAQNSLAQELMKKLTLR